MLNHVSIGVADVAHSGHFYDAALAPLFYSRLSDGETSIGYGSDTIGLWILKAEHPVAADPKSGLHICFNAPDHRAVDAFHRAALAAGGEDNGKPGLRADYGADYYAAFVIDPDGYRIEAYCGGKR